MTFDGNGRMYVAEMRSYMQDADATNEHDPIGVPAVVRAVKYVGIVDAYDSRIQSAIKIQGPEMERHAEFLLTRALKQAGWK